MKNNWITRVISLIGCAQSEPCEFWYNPPNFRSETMKHHFYGVYSTSTFTWVFNTTLCSVSKSCLSGREQGRGCGGAVVQSEKDQQKRRKRLSKLRKSWHPPVTKLPQYWRETIWTTTPFEEYYNSIIHRVSHRKEVLNIERWRTMEANLRYEDDDAVYPFHICSQKFISLFRNNLQMVYFTQRIFSRI